jgi:hypothetical protein
VPDWQSADDRNNREKVNRARQAAEDLFKPTQQPARDDLPSPAPSTGSPAEQQPPRQPRIFAVPSRMPAASATVEEPVQPRPMRVRAAANQQTATVPPSQEGRVRALTSYGMTRAQVAELYGVSVDEIERIIRVSPSSVKPR